MRSGESGDSNLTQLDWTDFQPGSIVAIRVSLHDKVKPALSLLGELVSGFTHRVVPSHEELREVISRLDLSDLNRALYRCAEEEREEGQGAGVYDIPDFGPTVYCGLQ
ncbi:unnamed protein product, partial [Timema podura]|nr:unnamed protein product [Timema podura]